VIRLTVGAEPVLCPVGANSIFRTEVSPEDGSVFLRSTCVYVQGHAALQPRTPGWTLHGREKLRSRLVGGVALYQLTVLLRFSGWGCTVSTDRAVEV
jgi:hypothetical protein